MAKKFIPSVLTANHLLEGDAVWWTGKEWSRDIAQAEVIGTSEDATTILEMASTSAAFEAEVVGPYLVEIDVASFAPVVRREAIRAHALPQWPARGPRSPAAVQRGPEIGRAHV